MGVGKRVREGLHPLARTLDRDDVSTARVSACYLQSGKHVIIISNRYC